MKRLLLTLLLLVSALAPLHAQTTSRTAIRIRWGTTLPATCDGVSGEVFFRSVTGRGIYYCSALNTWLPIGTTGTTGVFGAPDGTAAAPAFSFTSAGNEDNGMYLAGANAIGFSTAGTARWQINASGHFLAATDNVFDIGAVGATRPRTIYAGTSLIAPLATLAAGGMGTDGPILFTTDNTDDIGASGATRPRNLFVGTTTTTGSLIIASGANILGHLSGTGTYNPTSLTTGNSESFDITVTGAALGDTALCSYPSFGATNWTISCYVSATNTVKMVIENRTGGTVDLPSATVRGDVWKH